jgi:hypothetical protein
MITPTACCPPAAPQPAAPQPAGDRLRLVREAIALLHTTGADPAAVSAAAARALATMEPRPGHEIDDQLLAAAAGRFPVRVGEPGGDASAWRATPFATAAELRAAGITEAPPAVGARVAALAAILDGGPVAAPWRIERGAMYAGEVLVFSVEFTAGPAMRVLEPQVVAGCVAELERRGLRAYPVEECQPVPAARFATIVGNQYTSIVHFGIADAARVGPLFERLRSLCLVVQCDDPMLA